jgi:tRNA G18 (ribose-2'-O)-methylase SpoU
VFIAESELVIRRALAAGYPPRSMVMAPEWLERMAALVADVDAPVYSAPYDVLRELTGFHVHRGALASFSRRPLPSVGEITAAARRVAVLEDMVSHTNLGAVFRCAAALGMDAVVLSPSCADPLYRRAVRVSMGHVLALPFAVLPDWPAGLRRLHDAGFLTVALTPAADAVDLTEIDPLAHPRTAVLLGAEGPGLTPEAQAAARVRARIPMRAGVDSLGVAAAAAVAFATLR